MIRLFSSPLLRQMMLYAPGRAIPALISVILILVATRYISPASMGEYGLVIMAVLFLSTLAGGWLDQSAIRYYSRYEHANATTEFFRHHANALVLGAAIAICFGSLLFAIGLEFGVLDIHVGLIGLLLIVTAVLMSGSLSILQAKQSAHLYSAVEIARALLSLAASILGLYFGLDDARALLLGMLCGNLGVLPFAWKSAGLPFVVYPNASVLQYIRTAGRYGMPMLGWFVGSQILAITGRYMVQIYRGSEEVGIYHANFQLLPQALSLLFMPMLMAAHPIIISSHEKEGRDVAEATISRFTRYFLILSAGGGLLVSIVAEDLTRLLVGPEYQQGFVIVPWLAAGIIGWSLGMYAHKRFELESKTWLMLVAVFICAVINVVLCAVLIPRIGYAGAAIAAAISYWLYPIFVALCPGSSMRWRIPLGTIIRVVVCAAASLGFMWILRELWMPSALAAKVAFEGCLSMICFGSLLILSNEINRTERTKLRSALTKLVR